MTKLDEKWSFTKEAVGADGLSVVMPLYHLADEAAKNLREVAELFEQHEVKTELVPVDDGSGDGTDRVLESLCGGEGTPAPSEGAYGAGVPSRPQQKSIMSS